MAEFAAADLLTQAKLRYKEAILRNRMRGAADATAADAELTKIAESVIGRVRSAAQASVGWPVLVTANVLQRAMELFNWRTLNGQEVVSQDQRRVGESAEAYFNRLEDGSEAWGIESSADVSPSKPIAARSRDGSALISSLSDRRNIYDELKDGGWDWVQ